MRRDISDMAERWKRLLGGSNVPDRLMIALERKRTSAEDIAAGRNVPPDVCAILELLESCPRHLWPSRWSSVVDSMPRRNGGIGAHGFTQRTAAITVLSNGGTVGDAARAAGVSVGTIESWARAGIVPRSTVKRGRPRK